jgi:hypothetical protein
MTFTLRPELAFAFATPAEKPGATPSAPVEFRATTAQRRSETRFRPAIYTLSETAPGFEFRLHQLFGLFARIRSFASVDSCASALASAGARHESIALVVVGSEGRRRVIPRFLEYVSDVSKGGAVDFLYFGNKESLLFHGRELVEIFCGAPEDLDRRIISTIREAIERRYETAIAA